MTGRTDRPTWGATRGDELVPGRVVVRRLGGGRRAEAYLTSDDRLRTPVVVKILRPGQEDTGRAALRGEADVLRALTHPQFPRLLDADLEGARPYLVLELVEGPRLSRLVRRHGRLAVEQLVPLAVELASALHYLHGAGWVHLDVKPGNVVMAAPPRLIDLSLARTVAAAAALTTPVGTAAYMAPEQCAPVAGSVGPPADVYGMGATLYHAAVGARPYPRDDAGPKYPQLERDPAPLSRRVVPPPLADAIEATMARDPAARPTAAEVADLLESAVAALPGRPTLGRRRPRFRRR